MNSIELIILVLTLIWLVFGCGHKPTVERSPMIPIAKAATEEDRIRGIAEVHFSDHYQLLYNNDKSFVCIYSSIKRRPADIYSNITFLIYDITADQIIFAPRKVLHGSIRWIDNDIFESEVAVGRIQSHQKSRARMRYNMKTKMIGTID